MVRLNSVNRIAASSTFFLCIFDLKMWYFRFICRHFDGCISIWRLTVASFHYFTHNVRARALLFVCAAILWR